MLIDSTSCGPGTPASSSNVEATCVLHSRVATVPLVPLSRITLSYKESALGAPSSAEMLIAPADSPKSVTFLASPPNRAMFSRTQRSAAIWSSRPLFMLCA